MPLTFFEDCQSDVWVLHVDRPLESHVGEALDNICLTPLGNRVIKRCDEKLERGIVVVFLPLVSSQMVPLMDLIVAFAASIELADVSSFRS